MTEMQSKEELRACMRARRLSLDEETRLELSRRACAWLTAEPCWQGAGTVALYAAVRGETDTRLLLDAALREGKKTLLPVCSREKTGCMRLVAYWGAEKLATGLFSIPEPVPDAVVNADEERDIPADLIVVPGLAFDRNGNRLGMGGGYYDRLLALPAYSRTLCVGLAYSFQIVPFVPRRAWDRPMHALCTEEGLVWTTQI